MIRKRFDLDYASIPAESFLQHLKDAVPGLAAHLCGLEFPLRAEAGRPIPGPLLETGAALGVDVFSVDRIRHIRRGHQQHAHPGRPPGRADPARQRFAGYNYRSVGEVVPGAKMGRKLGFPTLNLPWAPECLPASAFTSCASEGTAGRAGTPVWANFGVKPTVAAEAPPAMEVHALEGTGLNVGDRIAVEWLRFHPAGGEVRVGRCAQGADRQGLRNGAGLCGQWLTRPRVPGARRRRVRAGR